MFGSSVMLIGLSVGFLTKTGFIHRIIILWVLQLGPFKDEWTNVGKRTAAETSWMDVYTEDLYSKSKKGCSSSVILSDGKFNVYLTVNWVHPHL